MEINAIIVEDEPILAKALSNLIATVNPDCRILTQLSSVKETIAWLNTNPEPCLIFMDIQLSDGICFGIFDETDVSNKGIVFTTAYDEYMLDAFEYNSISYLLKPIREEALVKTFEKIETAMSILKTAPQVPKFNQNLQRLAQAITKSIPQYRQRLVINKAEGYIQVPVDEIAYFWVEDRITRATTFKQKEHIIDSTLEKLEEELDPQTFFRVNRQFVININAIERLEYYFGSKLILKVIAPLNPAKKIVISRTKAPQLKQWLNQ